MLGPCLRHKWILSAAFAIVATLLAQGQAIAADAAPAAASHPDITVIAQKMARAQAENHAKVKPYSVKREYRVFGEDASNPRTEVIAEINFLPPNRKTYDIDESTGGMGEKVVRRILDHEVDAARDPRELLINSENYTFEYLGEQSFAGHDCYSIRMTPRHERHDLLKAVALVDKNSYLVVRLEGEPSKSPSFWVKDLHIVMDFADVSGMWLQTRTEALAHVRFGGAYNVTSRDLSYDTSRVLAANTTRTTLSHRRQAMLAADVR
jgi:hypothetical protein